MFIFCEHLFFVQHKTKTKKFADFIIFFSAFSKYKFGLSVCLYPINVKTAEPIGPKFCVRPHVTPGKVYV